MTNRRAGRARSIASALAITSTLFGTACVRTNSDRGIGTRLEHVSADDFVRGETTRGEVLERLGPPSQVLDLQDETAFYYVQEEIRSRGLVLLVYNVHREVAAYDRAVFFFDASGTLSDFAVTVTEE